MNNRPSTQILTLLANHPTKKQAKSLHVKMKRTSCSQSPDIVSSPTASPEGRCGLGRYSSQAGLPLYSLPSSPPPLPAGKRTETRSPPPPPCPWSRTWNYTINWNERHSAWPTITVHWDTRFCSTFPRFSKATSTRYFSCALCLLWLCFSIDSFCTNTSHETDGSWLFHIIILFLSTSPVQTRVVQFYYWTLWCFNLQLFSKSLLTRSFMQFFSCFVTFLMLDIYITDMLFHY